MLFSVLISYIIFLLIWRSKGFISNRYLLLIGVAYFFIGSYDLLQVLAFPELRLFPGFGLNLYAQFWIIARYMESISFLIAPMFLIQQTKLRMNASRALNSSRFARTVFFVYAIITAYIFVSVMQLKNFPMCYVEGSGFTSFIIISGYIICFIFLGSLVYLYKQKDKFETKVYNLLSIAIFLTLLGDGLFLVYNQVGEF